VTAELPPRPWPGLAGRIAPEVLEAPQTSADPLRPGVWPGVHEDLVGYLARNCVGTPWADHPGYCYHLDPLVPVYWLSDEIGPSVERAIARYQSAGR
jgi:hypothetical protein